MTTHAEIVAAIQALRPTSGFALDGDAYPDGLTWEDEGVKPPTLDEVKAAIAAPAPTAARVSARVLLGRLTDAELAAAKAALVAVGVLTPDRADIVFAP